MDSNKKAKFNRRQKRVRAKISGTASVPRFSIFRSNKHLYVQLIDDASAKTLVSAKDTEIKKSTSVKTSMDQAKALGSLAAKKAIEKNIASVVFDRSGYKYHGKVKAIADGAREGGLKF